MQINAANRRSQYLIINDAIEIMIAVRKHDVGKIELGKQLRKIDDKNIL